MPAPIARELAASVTAWQRFLLDDDGALLSTGRHTYRPSDHLRELVTARDLTCTFPGCGRPATAADLDHRNNYNGSNTTPANLHPLCRTHHRLKTHTNWHVRRNPTSGEDIWTSPLGNTYTHQPTNPWQPEDNNRHTNPEGRREHHHTNTTASDDAGNNTGGGANDGGLGVVDGGGANDGGLGVVD